MKNSLPWFSFSSRTGLLLGLLLLTAAGGVAYHNSLAGDFLFDDGPQIVNNPQIRRILPPGGAFHNNRRPILYLTLAVNYALGGETVWGYHMVNLLIHLAAGGLLFALLLLTLRRGRVGEAARSAAWGLSWVSAALWLVHPLQTESVTYVIQRTESLMGLFYLATIYAAARYILGRGRGWAGAAILSCALGMATKEVMVSAPLIVLAYDRIFFAAGLRDLLKKRSSFYVGLFSTWLILVVLLLTTRPEAVPTAGFAFKGMTPWQYGLTQGGVILHYLRLAVWPYPLVMDYMGWPVAQRLGDAAASLAGVGVLLGLTGWALRRYPAAGFLGLWFFLILAPSSSVMPIADVAFEHRMYLPLAAVMVLLVTGGWQLLRRGVPDRGWRTRISVVLAAGLTLAGIGMTIRRNQDYRSELTIWRDTVRKRPDNPRAQMLLGVALYEQGRLAEGKAHMLQSLALQPDEALSYSNLGNLLLDEGRYEEAKYYLRQGLRLPSPYTGVLYNNLGLAYARAGQFEQALEYYQAARQAGYQAGVVFSNIGVAYARLGRPDQARPFLREALRLNPADALAAQTLAEIPNRSLLGPPSP